MAAPTALEFFPLDEEPAARELALMQGGLEGRQCTWDEDLSCWMSADGPSPEHVNFHCSNHVFCYVYVCV